MSVSEPPTNLEVLPTSPSSAPKDGSGGVGTVATTTAHWCSDYDWQSAKPTVRERNKIMFNNDLMSDVQFKVGGKEFKVGGKDNCKVIPAHRYVLATSSSVFYAMFYGTMAVDQNVIEIPDVEPQAFLAMLKYMYCEDIDLEHDTVLATLYASKKYLLPHLSKACVHYLETSLSAKNACLLLSQSRLFEEDELTQQCWEVIDAQGEEALAADGFCDIDYSTLESILERESLNAPELILFKATLRWAVSECERRRLEPSADNKRVVLKNALHLIRFPCMTVEDFANEIVGTGVLTLKESNDLFCYFIAQNKPKLSFASAPRSGLQPMKCHRFQSCAFRSNQWRYSGRCDSIQFSVDKRIFLAGFGLYGSSSGSAEYRVRMELKKGGKTLKSHFTKFYSDGSNSTYSVFFPNPVQIEQDVFYSASVILEGTELSYFGQEGLTEVVAGQVSIQFQCSPDSTNGTGVQGGQIPELIFYYKAPVKTPQGPARKNIVPSKIELQKSKSLPQQQPGRAMSPTLDTTTQEPDNHITTSCSVDNNISVSL